MEDFKHKARFVAGGHTTKASDTITYASVVLRELLRIAMMMISLNDFEVKLDNILCSGTCYKRICGPLWVLSSARIPENCSDS